MLKHLYIRDLVLVESASIPFEAGFNVITGETGAGKSALLSALALVAGARSDTTLIRKGCSRATVEALFDIHDQPQVVQLLETGGINCDDNELLIKREIAVASKGRIFINHQIVQFQLLKQVGELLLHIVGQHANQLLFDNEAPRRYLDTYGSIRNDSATFNRLWSEWNAIQKRRDTLAASESARLRKIETLKTEIAELEEAAVSDDEEESLFATLSLLINAQERADKCHRIDQLLTSDSSALTLLEREEETLNALATIDTTMSEIAATYSSALLELREVAYSLTRYQSSIEFHPEKKEAVDQRLTRIDTLKRKYGPSLSDYLRNAYNELEQLEAADHDIDALDTLISDHSATLDAAAAALTQARREAADLLATAVTAELQNLNMTQARFEVEVTPRQRGSSGDDAVAWSLMANVGEGTLPLRSCASGGELSRVLLALHTLIAGQAGGATLIFDEIDANIGGKTAATIGNKLHTIGCNQQLLCITHFPQVAKEGDHHILISKAESAGRTHTTISVLNAATKKAELARMIGH